VLAFYDCVWVEYGPVCISLVFRQACQRVFFWGTFFWVGEGVLLEPYDSSDADDGDDTASDVFIRFSSISDMKFRDDLRELGLFYEKATLDKIEKYFLRPLDSFMNEWLVSQTLVRCIYTVRMRVVMSG
jgi:hypothetical protein